MSDIWAKESPLRLTAGAEPIYTIRYDGITTASITNAAMVVYKGSSLADVTTGSLSASGNYLTLKKLQSLTGSRGGKEYVVVVTATLDNVLSVCKFSLLVHCEYDKNNPDFEEWCVEGHKPPFAIVYLGKSVTATGAVMTVYKGPTDVTSTTTTGDIGALGDTLTLKTLTGLVGGNDYVIYVKATVSGVVETRRILLHVQRAKLRS